MAIGDRVGATATAGAANRHHLAEKSPSAKAEGLLCLGRGSLLRDLEYRSATEFTRRGHISALCGCLLKRARGAAQQLGVGKLGLRELTEAECSSLTHLGTKLNFIFPIYPDGQTVRLLFDQAGTIYSTTTEGGTGKLCEGEGGCGTVYRIQRSVSHQRKRPVEAH